MAEYDLHLQTATLSLDKLPIRYSAAWDNSLGMHFRDSLELSRYQDQFLDRMIYEMSAFVLAEKLVDKTIKKQARLRVYVPASWWQHFRQDVYPKLGRLGRWLLRRKPVRTKEIVKYETLVANFKQYATYPASDLVMAPKEIHKNIIVLKETIS